MSVIADRQRFEAASRATRCPEFDTGARNQRVVSVLRPRTLWIEGKDTACDDICPGERTPGFGRCFHAVGSVSVIGRHVFMCVDGGVLSKSDTNSSRNIHHGCFVRGRNSAPEVPCAPRKWQLFLPSTVPPAKPKTASLAYSRNARPNAFELCALLWGLTRYPFKNTVTHRQRNATPVLQTLR